ncbi:hypothetical protein Acy02nite_81070 [Actinoplanes cyaneus]|uniref:Co/Zn/Cd efflux system component n=1 Tax=Actinoplanes cyaneus TaxID=52696 RepID=A0A919ISH7_9ACTN|nr:hypothetical protein [Actinoplanes cyaneus]GID70226.1 hypothetical protein Acy02nite_81070 [Actinoplanes cyaneus]
MKTAVGVLVSLVLIAVVSVFVVLHRDPGAITLPVLGPECVVGAEGEVTLDLTQMANAATIAAVGVRKDMPEQAVVVALATALQESKLENLDGGDRDSVGLFQQRPSKGWGTVEQIKDPRYAAGKFYTALKKVKGWQNMRVTDAAQKVQRSAYPNAYEKWADEAKVLAGALLGEATGAVACRVTGDPALRGTAAATALMAGLKLDWGKQLDFASEQAAGLTLAVSNPSSGWRYAHWLVSHASATGLERVRFGSLEWHAPDGKWQQVTTPGSQDNRRVVAEVFN